MTNPLNVQTKLDAVNSMLASIGQTPVNSLDVAGIRDVNIAELALDSHTRAVLSQGWSFNTDENYPITPDGNDNILIPSTALWIEPCDRLKDYVERTNSGTRMLYDRENHTYTITDSPLKVDIIWAFDFESIPEAARMYIATRAARLFQSNVLGSDLLFKFTEMHEQEALATLKKLEARTKKRNILTGGHTSRAIHRRRFNP